MFQNLMGVHPGSSDSLKKNSKKAKFRTASSASVLSPQIPEMETNPDLIPKHGKFLPFCKSKLSPIMTFMVCTVINSAQMC